MSPLFILSCIGCYFSLLLLIAWLTSRNADNQSYFLANKSAPWYAVAFGMLSDSLSGVTFISVPGAVGTSQFSYLQLVFGYFFGYMVISQVLLPLYYRMNLTSIYTYLKERFGIFSQKTGSFFFLLSRLLGAAARLYLTATIVQEFVFDKMSESCRVPFSMSVTIIILLILLYTYKGGIKTLVWTDVFQSTFLLAGVVLSIAAISRELDFSFSRMISAIAESEYVKIFFWDANAKSFFPKQFLGGMFIAIAMTGLDQNMMQKNLACRTLSNAQKNIRWFSIVMVMVNVFFLSLGALLYLYASYKGISLPVNAENGKPITDHVFPCLALEQLGTFAAIMFIVGLTAATFSSADSVLTTLTTSFMIDILGEKSEGEEERIKKIRHLSHMGFAVLLLGAILVFRALNKQAIIDTVLFLATFTYGPLLGLFFFGILSKRKVNDKFVPVICLISPIICYVLNENSESWFNGYLFGNELLLVNGNITFAGLYLISRNKAYASE